MDHQALEQALSLWGRRLSRHRTISPQATSWREPRWIVTEISICLDVPTGWSLPQSLALQPQRKPKQLSLRRGWGPQDGLLPKFIENDQREKGEEAEVEEEVRRSL